MPTLLAVLAAAAVLTVPGLIALLPLQLPRRAALALAGPVSLAFTGVAGLIAEPVGIDFSWWQPLLLGLATAGIVQLLGRLTHAHWATSPVGWLLRGGSLLATPIHWPHFAAWLVSGAAATFVLFHQVGSLDTWSQTYDNLFHLNATISILETGDASSLHLRSLTEPARAIAFYPSGWHASAAMVVQLTGVTVPLAFNVLAIVAIAVLWLPGLAWLAERLAPQHARVVAVTAALLFGTAFGFFPYALLIWGVLYPSFLAYCIFPTGLAVAVVLAQRLSPKSQLHADPAHRALGLPTLLTIAAAWWVGALFTHPRTLVSMALLLMPLAVGVIAQWVAKGWRAGGHPRRAVTLALVGAGVVVIAAGAAAWLFVAHTYDVASRPVSDHLNGPQAQAVQSVWGGLWQVLTASALTGVGAESTGPLWFIALLVIASALWALSQRGLRWLGAAWIIVAVLFALAAGSNSDLTKLLTGLWYKDRYRLSALLPMAAVTLAAVFLATQAAREKLQRSVASLTPLVVAVTAWGSLFSPIGSAMAREYRLTDDAANDFVTTQTVEFQRTVVRDIVPIGQRVLGDPWDGSALTWLYADREPVFPHLTGNWDDDRSLIADRLAEINTDPAVCAALNRLNVEYVLYDSQQNFDGGDPAGNVFHGVHDAVEAGLFTEVAHSGTSSLYRVDQCE